MTAVGLKFPTDMTYETWERTGVQISRIVDSSAWCLGDWLICGQSNYSDRYQQAIAMAGLDYQTLRNYAWVARKIDFARRRPALSFQHHAEVAPLTPDEQDHWLEQAENKKWSRNKLREMIRQRRRLGHARDLPEQAVLPRVAVETERIARWRDAAEGSQHSLADWVILTLDEAASRALEGDEIRAAG